MRRAGNLWPEIASFGNLVRAARRAALGKRDVAGVARFLADLEPNVLSLQRELEAGTWAPGRAFTFEIHDPKTRTITAAPFADRVVHHALIDVLEPHLERRMLYESFACGAGRAQKNHRGTESAEEHREDQALEGCCGPKTTRRIPCLRSGTLKLINRPMRFPDKRRYVRS